MSLQLQLQDWGWRSEVSPHYMDSSIRLACCFPPICPPKHRFAVHRINHCFKRLAGFYETFSNLDGGCRETVPSPTQLLSKIPKVLSQAFPVHMHNESIPLSAVICVHFRPTQNFISNALSAETMTCWQCRASLLVMNLTLNALVRQSVFLSAN